MKKRKKILGTESLRRTMKKPYTAPQLIVHGTLQAITKKIGGLTDGSGTKSH